MRTDREYDLDYVRHPGAAAVVALDDRDRVCLVRQYRHGILDFLWEIPAGKLDPGEPPQICAVRELREETGVTAQRWTPLGTFLPAPGIFTEIIHLYWPAAWQSGPRIPMRTKNWSCSGCPCQKPAIGCCAASGTTEKRPWPCGEPNISCNCDGAQFSRPAR